MPKEKLTDELGRISEVLNGVIGRLCMHRHISEIREAHGTCIELGNWVDNLINELESEGE